MIALEATASAINYIALALVLGQLVAAGLLLPNGEPKELRRSLLVGARAALLVFLGVAVLALLVQGVKLQRGFPSLELLWRYLTMAQSGKVWLAREVYAASLALTLRLMGKHDAGANAVRLLAVLALPLVASRSLMSHAVAVREDTLIAVSSDALHLIVTALWAGGLIALWRVLRLATKQLNQPLPWTATIVNRFSCFALISVMLLVITGGYQSWIHVGSFTTLMNTDYGNALLLKLLLFSAMLGIGALNFLSTRRILARRVSQKGYDRGASGKALRRIGIESLIGLLIFGATGLLTVLPPGVHAVHQTAAATPPPAGKTDGAVEKNYLPAQGASVKILAPKTGEVFTSDRVPLRFTLIAGNRGHHVHAYVDGELMGMFQSKTGDLNGLKPGRHTLELRVVAADHQSELDAFDRVEFMVK
jgi:putative copper export protein